MKPRDYCCCAIPLVNPGIYTTLTEQFLLALIVGTLSVSTPVIVGAATPSFAKWILAVVCYVGAVIQVLGFMGVKQEKATLYRRYVTLHYGATTAVFAVAAVWVIISAARHSTAQTTCENTFFPSTNSSSTSSEGQTLCDIFSWVDVGLMGGAWVFFAIVQGYLLMVVSSYGSSQREDHEKYGLLHDPSQPFGDDIPMADRGDPWDSRYSTDAGALGHIRNESTASQVANAPMQRYNDNTSYMPERQLSQGSRSNQLSAANTFRQPSSAYTQNPQPTPQYNYFGGAEGPVDRPLPSQPHPAEGSFGRKAPRLAKAPPYAMY
ncbi:hypothetical protein CONPUDRAFT_148710 [Coniophora puteana RWD-64-598 SS2]|uniref:Uncharacterized protein n=1 Tax=Coniophora puteana (strain RWD-64-598) TaxID=741705 RepID=A0A5M3N5F1_CONPW|nr:uncharacterized protein CONPUDRAFT_148710 [Coniophora puteana RWD-64-598 SS2]EIW86640.1 hypothetical protein CONPUDRAFT_148710 [Coniophora puteana RWD-64-598 SS2]